MYEEALTQLTVAAETCENNAPIYEREDNNEQAAHARACAKSYRSAISALRAHGESNTDDQCRRADFLEMGLRTPGINNYQEVMDAATAYQKYIDGVEKSSRTPAIAYPEK